MQTYSGPGVGKVPGTVVRLVVSSPPAGLGFQTHPSNGRLASRRPAARSDRNRFLTPVLTPANTSPPSRHAVSDPFHDGGDHQRLCQPGHRERSVSRHNLGQDSAEGERGKLGHEETKRRISLVRVGPQPRPSDDRKVNPRDHAANEPTSTCHRLALFRLLTVRLFDSDMGSPEVIPAQAGMTFAEPDCLKLNNAKAQ